MLQNDKTKLKIWRLEKLNNCKEFPKFLYYLSPLENFKSIVENGILSKNETINKKLNSFSFADNDVQLWRKSKECVISNFEKKKLHDLVPLYLNPKTPTLYARKPIQDKLFLCLIDSKQLISDTGIEFAFTDGNAANRTTKFYRNLIDLNCLNWEIINSFSWNDKTDGKRIRNSEFLIFPKIDIKFIKMISCFDLDGVDRIKKILTENKLKIETNVNKNLFFDIL